MIESATPGLRERKRRHTAEQLSAVSRRLTAERGLAGFTIEELCEEVDVSRRTFFNYFDSKEDAVIGGNSGDETERFTREFLERGPRGWAAALDDLIQIISDYVDEAGIDTTEHSDFMLALEREPRLLARFIGDTRERERETVRIIALREGVAADDIHAEAVGSLLAALLRSVGDRLLLPGNTTDFTTLLSDALAAYRAVLASPSARKAAS